MYVPLHAHNLTSNQFVFFQIVLLFSIQDIFL